MTSKANYVNISAPLPLPVFTGTPTSGNIPLDVQFNDTTQSTSILYWNWSFGDSTWFNTTNSLARNATHTYSSTGSFTVNLSVTNSSGISTPASNTNTTSLANYISIAAFPVPDFTGTPRNGNATLSVQFNDTSVSPGITAWNWSFGDTTWFNTTTIATRNITHEYAAEGTYTVNLSLTNSSGTNTTSRTGYIVVGPPLPVPFFTSQPTTGTVPLFVQFNDTTLSPGVTIWNWSFGDGNWTNTTVSSLRNVSYTYPDAGIYTVNLSITNSTGRNTTSRLDYITVSSPGSPLADFTGTPTSGTVPLFVQFTDTSQSLNLVSWNWSFGDTTWLNTTDSTLRSPSHTYQNAGTYTVNLTITNSSGSNTRSRSAYIIATNPTSSGGESSGDTDSGYVSKPTAGVTSGQTPEPEIIATAVPEATPAGPIVYTKTITFSQKDLVFSVSPQGPPRFAFERKPAIQSGLGVAVKDNILAIVQPQQYTIIVTGTGPLEVQNEIITGTVKTIILEIFPVTETVDAGQVTAWAKASLNTVPGNTAITLKVTDAITQTVLDGFQLAATRENREITAIAYTVSFDKENLEGIGPTDIFMTCPPEWVDAHGGPDSIRIIRTGDDGLTKELPTTFDGIDANGNMIFKGYSAGGLSVFGLVSVRDRIVNAAVTTLPDQGPRAAPSPEREQGVIPAIAGFLMKNIFVTIAGVIAVLLLLIGFWKRRRKYDLLSLK
jgi:PKD repeat protein